MTSELVNNVASAVEQSAPDAPVVEIGEAVAKTIASPSVPVLLEDMVLAHQLANDVKAKLAGKHLAVKDIFTWLLNLA